MKFEDFLRAFIETTDESWIRLLADEIPRVSTPIFESFRQDILDLAELVPESDLTADDLIRRWFGD